LQIFPIPDKPWYLPGFATACATLAFTLIGFGSLPFWLLWEARRRKAKNGHAMPLRALEDAQQAHISAAAKAKEREQALREEKIGGDLESASHVEQVEMENSKN